VRVLRGMSGLTELRRQAAECTACELYVDATQTVFGCGRPGASMMLVGEQALDRAGVGTADAYVTNVVKHFRFRLGCSR
jgi:uracil-DNA glycosylase